MISIYGIVADPASVQEQLAQIGRLLPAEAYQVIDKQLASEGHGHIAQ